MVLRSTRLYSVCCLALWLFGCPKRQTTPRIVYVPPAPASEAPSSSESSSGTLVIEQPAPPEPEEAPAPLEAAPAKPSARPHRREPSSSEPPAQETVEQPPAEIPALETHESPQQQIELRSRVLSTQQNIRARLGQIDRAKLSGLERKTLEDAGSFLAQSERALESGDLLRALNLARKASLLASALE